MPIEVLVDECISLDAPKDALLKAELTDDYGHLWSSLSSSEKAMDWLVTMECKEMPSIYAKKSLEPTLISLKWLHKDKVIATQMVRQHYLGKGVTYEERGEGRIYHPKKARSQIGVIVMSGSSGGRPDTRAALLASRGFTAYALPYFRYGQLPKELERIPLEYFEEAIQWFKGEVKGVALMGTSKGGELSLILGTLFDVDKIVAYVPSCATYGGFPHFHLPAWTYRGKDFKVAPVIPPKILTSPIVATPFFLTSFGQIGPARIPVEKITCPLLVISGSDDKMWPSKDFGYNIANHCPQTIHLCYEGAGHLISFPYVPLTATVGKSPIDGNLYEMGGKLYPHLHACEDSWTKIQQFLAT